MGTTVRFAPPPPSTVSTGSPRPAWAHPAQIEKPGMQHKRAAQQGREKAGRDAAEAEVSDKHHKGDISAAAIKQEEERLRKAETARAAEVRALKPPV